MRQYITGIFSAVALILSCNAVKAQDSGYDVFNPIAKYITQGDAEKLSAWAYVPYCFRGQKAYCVGMPPWAK